MERGDLQPHHTKASAASAPNNAVEIRLIGMSRSGNHALANWILAQARGRSCYLNCTEPGENPFVSARPFDDGTVYRANYPEFDLEGEQRGLLSRKDLLLYSHEDCYLGYVRKRDLAARRERWVGRSQRRIDVLLLRDPFNLFASRLKVNPEQRPRAALQMWKQHAREFTGERRVLDGERVAVNYNAWVRSVDYRRRIAAALGLRFTDAGRQDVPRVAAGSSFDGHEFDGRAAEMQVDVRWRWLEDSAAFHALFDGQTLALAERIFGRVCSDDFYARLAVRN